MVLYPFWFIFTLAYNTIALKSAINMSDDISYLSFALKEYVCNLYVYREIRREVKES